MPSVEQPPYQHRNQPQRAAQRDFEIYKGCCRVQPDPTSTFMGQQGSDIAAHIARYLGGTRSIVPSYLHYA